MDAFIRDCDVCRLGLCDRGEPYIVPMCFGYDGNAIYLHCAVEGRKVDILRRNNRVCFEFDHMISMVEADVACSWSIRYRSVVGTGNAIFVDDPQEKRLALAHVMANYSSAAYTFPDQALARILVIRIAIETINGKQSL